MNGPRNTRHQAHRRIRSQVPWALLVLSCFSFSCDLFDDDDDTFVVEGTVRFAQIEGGCWYILASDQARYLPINLPSELRQDGLPIVVQVKPRDDWASACGFGRIVEIVRIL